MADEGQQDSTEQPEVTEAVVEDNQPLTVEEAQAKFEQILQPEDVAEQEEQAPKEGQAEDPEGEEIQAEEEATEKTYTLPVGEDGQEVEVAGNEEIEYDGETHTAANLFDALKEGYYGKF